MHVYTARISRALLDRFRHPNRPPTNTTDHITDPLLRLHHRRVPYEPQATFRHRLIAAVSVTAIIKPNQADGNPGRGIKRASSPPGRVHHASPKRRRPPECPRDPLSILDPNGDHYAQHSSSSLSAPCT